MNKTFKLFAVLTLVASLSAFAFGQGKAAVNLDLTNLEGEKYSLADDKGKVVVFAIGAAWLPLTKNQAIVTSRLAKKYAGKNVVIYFVATDSVNPKSKNFATVEQIKAAATRAKMTAPILRDPEGLSTLKKYEVDQIPSFVVLDKEGKMVGEAFGGLTPDAETELVTQISATIDKLL